MAIAGLMAIWLLASPSFALAASGGSLQNPAGFSPLLSITPAEVWVDSTYTALSCGGHTWGVDAFTTVQAGINAVAAGGTVNVAAGTYAENLTVGKSLSILGPNASISPNGGTRAAEATIAPTTTAISATENTITVVVKGVTLNGAGASGSGFYAGTHDTTWTFEHIINTSFNGYPYAGWYIGSPNAYSFDLNVLDNYFTGQTDTGSNGLMIDTGAVVDLNIQDNVWKNNASNVMNINGARGTIANNLFLDTRTGITNAERQRGFMLAN